MYNSPVTPTGTNRCSSSSTYISVLSIPLPILTRSPAPTSHTLDHTVVSVGPYRFHTAPEPLFSRCANSQLNASPPHNTNCPAALRQPASNSNRHVAGVACITVTSHCCHFSSSARASPVSALAASNNRAPRLNGRNSSSAAMSNESEVTARKVCPAATVSRRPKLLSRLTTPRCGICTPFGAPVEPEV